MLAFSNLSVRQKAEAIAQAQKNTKKLSTARRMKPTHTSAHSFSSVLSENVSLWLDVESPDNAPSTGRST